MYERNPLNHNLENEFLTQVKEKKTFKLHTIPLMQNHTVWTNRQHTYTEYTMKSCVKPVF